MADPRGMRCPSQTPPLRPRAPAAPRAQLHEKHIAAANDPGLRCDGPLSGKGQGFVMGHMMAKSETLEHWLASVCD
eukprot:740531-Pelagomonas_calceolata.AAC.4